MKIERLVQDNIKKTKEEIIEEKRRKLKEQHQALFKIIQEDESLSSN